MELFLLIHLCGFILFIAITAIAAGYNDRAFSTKDIQAAIFWEISILVLLGTAISIFKDTKGN